jgi:hypothetical protein
MHASGRVGTHTREELMGNWMNKYKGCYAATLEKGPVMPLEATREAVKEMARLPPLKPLQGIDDDARVARQIGNTDEYRERMDMKLIGEVDG